MPEYVTINLTWKDVVGVMEALGRTSMEHLRQAEENDDPIECIRSSEFAALNAKFRNAALTALRNLPNDQSAH